jgi:hypothetical protein
MTENSEGNSTKAWIEFLRNIPDDMQGFAESGARYLREGVARPARENFIDLLQDRIRQLKQSEGMTVEDTPLAGECHRYILRDKNGKTRIEIPFFEVKTKP